MPTAIVNLHEHSRVSAVGALTNYFVVVIPFGQPTSSTIFFYSEL
jgi:hypothetical protein